MLSSRRLALAIAVLVASLIGVATASAALFQPGATKLPPVMTSAAAPERQALILAPDFANGGTPRGAVALSDAAAYRDLLRLLGFAVTVVAVDTRPTLDIESRTFATGVRRDGDVAVFVLGSVIGADGKLYVPAADLPAGTRAPERVATESLDLTEIMRRIQANGPRQLVAIVDECGAGEAQPACPTGALPDNASVILAKRLPPRGDGMPQAGIASLRGELLPLMQEPDLSFIKLFERLKAKLDGTNATVVASAALSRDFAFLPGDFLAKLPLACNKVDAGLSAEALKAAPSVAPLVPACESAARTWAFSPTFKDKLATAREQLAFQRAMTSCDDRSADAYLDAYPSGAYRFAANDHKAECARQREPPPAPPAPPPQPPPAPVAEEPSLRQRAYDAVVDYYQKHDYSYGGDMSALAAIYPSAFDRHGTPIARDVHLRELARFYAPYASFTFTVLSSSLDYSGCGDAAFCLMRGVAQRTSRKLNETATGTGRLRFSLRFDLTRGTRVLSECAMVEGRATREKPCD